MLMYPPLQKLVEVGFRLSTGPVEALRPGGVRLLDFVVHTFAAVGDPLLPGVEGGGSGGDLLRRRTLAQMPGH